MKKLIALCAIALMSFAVAAPVFTDVGVHKADSSVKVIKFTDLVFVNDAVSPVVIPSLVKSVKLFHASDLLSGVSVEVPANNNSPPFCLNKPPTTRYLS